MKRIASRRNGQYPPLKKIKQAGLLFPQMVDVLPEGARGNVEIHHFTVSAGQAMINTYSRLEKWLPGRYCELRIDGIGWMYDAPEERLWNQEVVEKASGRVLIAGLGMGMILHPILAKTGVESVLVLENNQNVVDLVAPTIPDPGKKLVIEIADATTWEPPAGELYDTIWLDVVPFYAWDHRFLHIAETMMAHYRPFLSPGGWISHWAYMEVITELLARMDERVDDAREKARQAMLDPAAERNIDLLGAGSVRVLDNGGWEICS